MIENKQDYKTFGEVKKPYDAPKVEIIEKAENFISELPKEENL